MRSMWVRCFPDNRPEPVAIGHRDHGGVTVPQRLPLAAVAELVSEKPQTVEKAT